MLSIYHIKCKVGMTVSMQWVVHLSSWMGSSLRARIGLLSSESKFSQADSSLLAHLHALSFLPSVPGHDVFFLPRKLFFSHFYLAKFLSHFERPTLVLILRQWQCHENLGFPQSPSVTLLNTASGQDHWAFCSILSHPASLSLTHEACQNDDCFQVSLLCFQGWLYLHLCLHSSLHMPPLQYHHTIL